MSNDFLKYAISGEHFQSGFQLIIQISEERNLQRFNLMKAHNWEFSRFLFAHTFCNVLNEFQHYVYKESSAFNSRRKFSWLNSFFLRNFNLFLKFHLKKKRIFIIRLHYFPFTDSFHPPVSMHFTYSKLWTCICMRQPTRLIDRSVKIDNRHVCKDVLLNGSLLLLCYSHCFCEALKCMHLNKTYSLEVM